MTAQDRKFTSDDYSEAHADAFAARYDDGLRAIKLFKVREFVGPVDRQRVLDLGCGVGYIAALLADLGARIVACDFADSMVRRTASRYGSRFPVVRCSAEELPFREERFDLVLAFDVIEHLYEPERMLRCVRRVLNPTGRLLIITDRLGFQLGTLPNRLLKWVPISRRSRGDHARYGTPLCTHVHEYHLAELQERVESAGFQARRYDTFPNRREYGTFGRAVELLGRGPLKRLKWNHCICEFLKSESPHANRS